MVTGIGFLGAGTIIRSRFHVSGLTTAATIWVLSGLGLVIGAGYILLAVVAGILITITLTFVDLLERMLKKRHGYYIVQLDLKSREGILGNILELFANQGITATAQEINRRGESWTAIFEYDASTEKHGRLLDSLAQLEEVRKITEL